MLQSFAVNHHSLWQIIEGYQLKRTILLIVTALYLREESLGKKAELIHALSIKIR